MLDLQHIRTNGLEYVCIYVCMGQSVCVCVCMCVCVCVCLYPEQ